MEPRGRFSKENILKNGSIEVHVKINGIRQRHTLRVEREKTAFGMVPYLVCDKSLPTNELLRLAEELQFPIKCKGMRVFPKGKAAKDFAESEPEKKRSLSHDRIMNDEAKPQEKEKTEKQENENSQEAEKEETEGEEESESESDTQPENEMEEEEKDEAGTDERDEGPEPAQEGEKSTESIEIEGSSQNKKNDDAESPSQDKPEEKKERKKIFSGVLSEGILT